VSGRVEAIGSRLLSLTVCCSEAAKGETFVFKTLGLMVLLAVSVGVAHLSGSLVHALWPAIAAFIGILFFKEATLGLACGVVAGTLVVVQADPIALWHTLFADFLFPGLQGPWRIGAVLFTLMLGAFAGILEASRGFEALLLRHAGAGVLSDRRVLGVVYLTGLLCFFDGLASSLLTGRVARTLVDRAGISRERLAWVVDSTASPVACVSFISTWIATQLSLIAQGTQHAPFSAAPYALYFQSIVANPYCLLTLWVVPLSIALRYQPAAMARFTVTAASGSTTHDAACCANPQRVVIIPLAVLILAIIIGFPLLMSQPPDIRHLDGWQQAFSGDGGPYALVFGASLALGTAWLCFPAHRRHEVGPAAIQGAASVLPALLILILAYALGGILNHLGAAKALLALLGTGFTVTVFPAVIFTLAGAMSFVTGSSWGTMGLLTPLVLPAGLLACQQSGLSVAETQGLVVATIGAVFGGATFGDHCSPFSDTTIVSALASGCKTLDHVTSQMPFAALCALFSFGAYLLLPLGLPTWLTLAIAALGLTLVIAVLTRHSRLRKRAIEEPPLKATSAGT